MEEEGDVDRCMMTTLTVTTAAKHTEKEKKREN